MRLFIAIELPDRHNRDLELLRADIPGSRWVPAEQLHLTLAFLGEVAEETAALLARELSRICASPFTLSFAGTGCFPNRHQPRVVWVGIKAEPCLTARAYKVHETVLACGIPQEERPFSPHLTLARLKLPGARETAAFLDLHRSVTMPPFPVTEFILFQSQLTRQGAVHLPLRRFTLQCEQC